MAEEVQESKRLKVSEQYYGIAAIALVHIFPLITSVPVYLQLFVNSIAAVYIGSFYSVLISEKKEKLSRIEENSETISQKDAYMFPVYGSAVLFGLYVVFKFINKDLFGTVLTLYFGMLGQFCVMSFIETTLGKSAESMKSKVLFKSNFKLNLIFKTEDVNIEINQLNLILFLVTLVPTTLYLLTQNWLLNNFFGLIFSVTGIQAMNLPSFKVGFILLWGLFFYDIFWVYGTDVMLTVATSVNAPIKLMFPIDLYSSPPKFSMLGLGDIVIPGIFVALCLKFDVDSQIKKIKSMADIKTTFFNLSFLGYVAGIFVTFAVMIIFKHAQPALLFLVPGITIPVLLGAFIYGKLNEVLNYSGEQEKKEESNKTEENAKEVSKKDNKGN